MKLPARLAGMAGLVLSVVGLAAGPASAASPWRSGHRDSGAVFVQTDNPAGNAIVAYDRSADGALQQAGTYPTGGLGGMLSGSVVDHLASQGSLAYDRRSRLLYAVNAGSNTITVFAVRGDQLIRRQVIYSGGAFPVSIARFGDLVYVLNARDGGSVQGFARFGDTLARIPSWHRALGLDPTETPEFTHTPGQVAFTPDGSKLIVTTKANGNDIDVFAVRRGGSLSAAPVVNSEPAGVPFGVAFDSFGHLAVALAGPNAVASFGVEPGGGLAPIDQAATGQMATCWIVRVGSVFYASNAGSADVSAYREAGDGTLTPLGNTGTDAGTVDATSTLDGRFLYVQTGANGIVDEFRAGPDGSLAALGSVTVPGSIGGEGIAAS